MKWVTREYVHLDRVASPWLITRFVDPDATFVFVKWNEESAAPTDAISFGMPGAELGPHDGAGTTFSKIVEKYALTDPAVHRISHIIDLGVAHVLAGYRPGPEDEDGQIAVGLLGIAEGMMLIKQDDAAILDASFVVYDALLARFRTLDAMDERGVPMFGHADGRGPSLQFEGMRAIFNQLPVAVGRS